jgi:hypothetical protein
MADCTDTEGDRCNRPVPPAVNVWAAPEMGRMSIHPPPSPKVLEEGYTNKVRICGLYVV